MGCAQTVPSKSSVVIVGAGYAGTYVALALERKGFQVTIIDKHDFMYHSIGALRASVNDNFAPRVLIPSSSLLKKGKFVQGEVKDVLDNAVLLTSGESISFDALVIATGASGSFPGKIPPGATSAQDVLAAFRNTSKAVKAARSIVIIGGGPVGVELAGEIAFAYPNGKKLHLFESHNTLLDNLVVPVNAEMKRRTLELLQSHSVEVHLEQRVDIAAINAALDAQNSARGVLTPVLDCTEGEPFLVRSNTGVEVSADLVFLCVGNSTTVGTNALHESSWWKAHASDSNPTRLRVNQHLQVEGAAANVFVVGDAAALNENQQGYYAMQMHPPVLVKNLSSVLASMSNLPAQPLAVYTPQSSPALLLPFGARSGVTQFGNSIMGPRFTSMMKGGDLFTTKQWTSRNVTPPRA